MKTKVMNASPMKMPTKNEPNAKIPMPLKPHNDIRQLVSRLKTAALRVDRPLAFMEVCGTHTMSAFRCGLKSVLPANVRLISGPGCPVCVTAQSDIDLMVEVAGRDNVTLCTYGDMLRVPGRRGSLETARMAGADVRVIYSSLDALALAEKVPGREVVFAAVGFETTAPATAAAILEASRRGVRNFSVLASHKRIIPAMRALLDAAPTTGLGVDGFMAPGHVSVIIGARAYEPIVAEYRKSCVIGGFEPQQMLAALADLTELALAGRNALINQYPEVVRADGNPAAQKLLADIFEPCKARWRGLGAMDESGLRVRPAYLQFDARARFALEQPQENEPRGCICGQVISGLAEPYECKLFGKVCTPINPIGPCMVSSEGTCAAWFKYGCGGGQPAQQPAQQEVMP